MAKIRLATEEFQIDRGIPRDIVVMTMKKPSRGSFILEELAAYEAVPDDFSFDNPKDAGISRGMVVADFRRKHKPFVLDGLGEDIFITPKSSIPKLKPSIRLENIKTVQQAREYASGSFHAAKDKAEKTSGRRKELYELAANNYAGAYHLGDVVAKSGAQVLVSGVSAEKTVQGMIIGIKQGDGVFKQAHAMGSTEVSIEPVRNGPSAVEEKAKLFSRNAKIGIAVGLGLAAIFIWAKI